MQSVIKFTAKSNDTVVISASTDKAMKLSKNAKIVQPVKLVNQPQTHFARLRLDQNYKVEHKNHLVTGRISIDLTKDIQRLFP